MERGQGVAAKVEAREHIETEETRPSSSRENAETMHRAPRRFISLLQIGIGLRDIVRRRVESFALPQKKIISAGKSNSIC
jgi:hypothetical protein